MSLPFDATLKDLAQINPKGILAAFDVVTSLPVILLNVDLSTVTTSTDVVFGTRPRQVPDHSRNMTPCRESWSLAGGSGLTPELRTW